MANKNKILNGDAMNNINKTIKHFESLQKRYTTQHNGQMCERVADALEALSCFKSMEQNGVVGEFIGKPITVYYLQKILLCLHPYFAYSCAILEHSCESGEVAC